MQILNMNDPNDANSGHVPDFEKATTLPETIPA
jgi:hypothetical protein